MMGGIIFADNLLLERIVLSNGAEIYLGEGAMCMGAARKMSIVMQPSHGGLAPWVRIVWSEENYPDEYINLATVQKVKFKGG